MRQAMRAPFFRGKLDHVDLDRLDDPREWGKIPLLDKDMLRAMSDQQFYRDFCLPPEADDCVAQYWRSGGTTGRPLFYPRSRVDIEVAHARVCARLCLRGRRAPGQTVHCAFPLGIHPVGQMMARAAEASNMGALMAGAGTTTPSALQIELIDKLRPNVLVGMSSYALHLANLADHNGIDLAGGSVRLVICSAEPLSAAKREKLGRMWGAQVRDLFGMTEAGMMAAEDGQADGFRVWSDLFFIEVVDPHTREPVADGEVGALVVTPLYTNNITPFLRWMSGDLVMLRDDVPGSGPFAVFPVMRHAQRTSGLFQDPRHQYQPRRVRRPDVSVGADQRFQMRGSDHRRSGCASRLRRDQARRRPKAALHAVQATRSNGCSKSRQWWRRLELGTLAREFESSIKAPRIIDKRG